MKIEHKFLGASYVAYAPEGFNITPGAVSIRVRTYLYPDDRVRAEQDAWREESLTTTDEHLTLLAKAKGHATWGDEECRDFIAATYGEKSESLDKFVS